MRYLLSITMFLVACQGHREERAPDRVCERDPSASEVLYPDGVTRKSDTVLCTLSDGSQCMYATWVNDPSITFTTCQ